MLCPMFTVKIFRQSSRILAINIITLGRLIVKSYNSYYYRALMISLIGHVDERFYCEFNIYRPKIGFSSYKPLNCLFL